MAGELSAERYANWNPLNCSGTEIPANILLMAKLLVVVVVLKGEWAGLPERYLPMIPALDWIPGAAFEWILKGAFLLAATGLMVNRSVRTCCIILGVVFLLALLGTRGYYRNSKFFIALMFIMAGLQERGRNSWIFPVQFAVMYFGSGLNKLFEPDWWDGQYFHHWTHSILEHRAGIYQTVAGFFPERWFSIAMGWMTIVVELILLPILLLIPRLRSSGIWFAIAFHGVALFMTRQEFGPFYAVLLVSYLSLVPWPTALSAANATGTRWLKRLDTSHMLTLNESDEWFLSTAERQFSGFRAVQRMTSLLPPLYLLGIFVLAAPHVGSIGKYVVTVVGFVLYFPATAYAVDWIRRRP